MKPAKPNKPAIPATHSESADVVGKIGAADKRIDSHMSEELQKAERRTKAMSFDECKAREIYLLEAMKHRISDGPAGAGLWGCVPTMYEAWLISLRLGFGSGPLNYYEAAAGPTTRKLVIAPCWPLSGPSWEYIMFAWREVDGKQIVMFDDKIDDECQRQFNCRFDAWISAVHAAVQYDFKNEFDIPPRMRDLALLHWLTEARCVLSDSFPASAVLSSSALPTDVTKSAKVSASPITPNEDSAAVDISKGEWSQAVFQVKDIAAVIKCGAEWDTVVAMMPKDSIHRPTRQRCMVRYDVLSDGWRKQLRAIETDLTRPKK